jgi:hypothetical protein
MSKPQQTRDEGRESWQTSVDVLVANRRQVELIFLSRDCNKNTPVAYLFHAFIPYDHAATSLPPQRQE